MIVLCTELFPSFPAKGKTVLAITHDGRYFRLAEPLAASQITDINHPSQHPC